MGGGRFGVVCVRSVVVMRPVISVIQSFGKARKATENAVNDAGSARRVTACTRRERLQREEAIAVSLVKLRKSWRRGLSSP